MREWTVSNGSSDALPICFNQSTRQPLAMQRSSICRQTRTSMERNTHGWGLCSTLATSSGAYRPIFAWYRSDSTREYPTNLLLQRLPVAKFMSGTVGIRSRISDSISLTAPKVILWGIVLMCHAAAHNFAGLAAARTLLGVFEASINPGTMLIFSMWYKRSEQPLRMGIWIGSAGIGYVLAGIASFGIGHIHGALSSWRYMFLVSTYYTRQPQ